MTPERWHRVKEIAADLLEQKPIDCVAFVAQLCEGDAEVERAVLKIAAADRESPDEFLMTPPWRLSGLTTMSLGPAERLSPGQVLAGRFEIISFLGQGGMGAVYEAKDLELKEQIALKTIRPQIARLGHVIERFKQEVKHTRRITHPNVCRVHDLFFHKSGRDGLWFLTMQLLRGRTLRERLAEDGRIPLKQAQPLIADVLGALSAAHGLGIVHRDLKPSNIILVTEDGRERAVVTDFGLALSLESQDEASALDGGTPAYMAPEQAAGEVVSAAADQYALGILILEMLTGVRAAVSGPEGPIDRWVGKIQADRFGRRVSAAVRRCLRRQPSDRFRNVDELSRFLQTNRASKWKRWTVIAAVSAGAMSLGALVAEVAIEGGYRVIEPTQLTSGTDLSGSPSLSADGKRIAYMSDRAEPGNLDIWLQETSGLHPIRLTRHFTEDGDPSLSPDGKFVAFRSERNGGGIYLVNADGTGERLLVPGGRHPKLSPDGRTLAYWTGDKDTTVPSGQLYMMDLKNGNPRRLPDDFSDARNPIWSSDGRALLFEGCPSGNTPLATCEEWWTVRADGSDFRSTGGLAQLEKDSVEPQSPPEAWLGDMVVFSARHNDQITLWELNISRKDSRVYGNAHQITTSGTQERAASLATNGTIAFGRVASGLHIWQVPLGASSPSRGPSKATDDLGSDGCPSSSRDGRWLFFSRRLGNERNIVAKDLSSGRESVLVAAAQQDAFWPVSNATGSRVAYELRKKTRSSIGVISPGAQPRTLCTNCAHPSSWFGDKGVLYSNPEGAIAIVSAMTGSSRIVVPSEENISLGDADWSPTHEYLLFTRTRRGGGNQLMVVRLPLGTEQLQGRPVSILDTTGRADRPRWSHDGRTVYYLSKQDGFMCIWGQPFDPNLGVATGVPYPVIHYHNPRTTPDRTSLAVLGLAVTRDSVFVSSGEVTESVWTGMLNTPGIFENLRRFLSSALAQ